MGFKVAITIDNENFGRNADEAQIIRGVLPADGRINIAATFPIKKFFGRLSQAALKFFV